MPAAAHAEPNVGILILAGGKATRLPGKLFLDAGGLPLLERVYRNLTAREPQREILVACNAAQRERIQTLLPVPTIVDRWSGRGPLSGMLTGFEAMHASRVFVAAGDAPFVDATLLRTLLGAWKHGDECAVAQSGKGACLRFEPLAGLYDRVAFLRSGSELLRAGGGAVHRVIERLRVRAVTQVDPRTFVNVNTAAEYDALLAALN